MSTTGTLTRKKMGSAALPWQIGLLVFILGYWQWGPLDEGLLSRPSAITTRLWQELAAGDILVDIGITLQEVVLGYLLGVVTGLLAAYFLNAFPTVFEVLQPYLLALQGLPKVAIAPLFIIWLGIGPDAKIVIAASLVFFLIFFNTLLGLQMVDQDYLNIAIVMGASRSDIARKILVPSVLPYLMTGLKIALPYAVIGAVTGEFIASRDGLGSFILTATSQIDTAGTFVGIVLLLAIVLIGSTLLSILQRKVTPWSPNSGRATSP
jgi:NitT/TauT family transport system permease protein